MNPDDLLQQIADLLGQYLALGPNTPVAPQAQQLMDAIQGAVGDPQGMGMPQGGPPPDPSQGGGMPPGGPMPDIQGMQPSGTPTSNGGAHPFADASAMAIDDIKKKMNQGR